MKGNPVPAEDVKILKDAHEKNMAEYMRNNPLPEIIRNPVKNIPKDYRTELSMVLDVIQNDMIDVFDKWRDLLK